MTQPSPTSPHRPYAPQAGSLPLRLQPWFGFCVVVVLHTPWVAWMASFFQHAPIWRVWIGVYLLVVLAALLWFQRELMPRRADPPVLELSTLALGVSGVTMAVWAEDPSLQSVSLPLCLHAWLRTHYPASVADRLALPTYLLALWVPFCLMPMAGSRLELAGCLLAARLGGAALQVLGYPTEVQGTLVFTRGVPNSVEPGCDGFTIFATIAFFAIAVGSFRGHGTGLVARVFTGVLPFAILGNAARVATVSMAWDRWGASYPEILAHDGPSFVTAALCYLVVFHWLNPRPPVDLGVPALEAA